MIDRKAVLVALAKANQLSGERALIVRAGEENVVRRYLMDWGVDNIVREAAGMPGSADPAEATDQKIQDMVNLHLLSLGLEPLQIEWLHFRSGEKVDLEYQWEKHLSGKEFPFGHAMGLPGRVSRLMAMADLPAWQPLVWLIERGVWPFGPERGGKFIVSRKA